MNRSRPHSGPARILACLCLLAAVLPRLEAQEEPAGGWTADKGIRVSVRDGTAIELDVYRPAAAGRYPALYLAGPFPHDTGATPPSGARTGPVEWYVSQGYAVVLASTRGTGGSGGEYGFLSREEQQDHYEIIEWIASQNWSNQKVAGAGAGYYATSQWLAAIQNPPHLECIAPYDGVPDPYRDWAFQGGLANPAFTAWYDREVRQANAYPVDAPARLVEYDLRFQQLLHPRYDDFWRLRSAREDFPRIGVPVFMLRGWGEPGMDSTLRALDGLDSLNKLLLLDDDGSLYGSPAFHARELLPFYEWCLKDRGDAFIITPRIRYQPRGQEQVKREATWPPGNVSQAALYLNPASPAEDTDSGGSLDFAPLEGGFDVSAASPLAEGGLRFISPPLERDLEIAGPLMMELYVSSSARDTAFEVRVIEAAVQRRIEGGAGVLPSFLDPLGAGDGLFTAISSVPVGAGSLKASARATTVAGSPDYRPFHIHGEPQWLEPGRVHRLDIALGQTAYRFRQGNRIVVEIRKAVDGSLVRLRGSDTIHHSAQFPSRLWIPRVQVR